MIDYIKRNILLNPGPSTTTDTVKLAQVVPDICPREKEFACLMKSLREDLVKIVHGNLNRYTSVLFCGSGTINIDACISSLLPKDKKILIVNNGAYSTRAVEVSKYYNLPYIDLKFPEDCIPDIKVIDEVLKENSDIEIVYTTHNETGTGICNPIQEIGALAHKYNAIFIVDTTSTYAMKPISIEEDNIDFCMASAQKGIGSFVGLSFVIGKKSILEKSKEYPKRSYYCNLYMQYEFLEKNGEMHFTPPVQTIYATIQALKEYWNEGENEKWARHTRVFNAINNGLDELGFRQFIKPEWRTGLVACVVYPDDPNWDFEKIHDYCYERGFTIYPGKITELNTFRICALGAIDEKDIKAFFNIFKQALVKEKVTIPVVYMDS